MWSCSQSQCGEWRLSSQPPVSSSPPLPPVADAVQPTPSLLWVAPPPSPWGGGGSALYAVQNAPSTYSQERRKIGDSACYEHTPFPFFFMLLSPWLSLKASRERLGHAGQAATMEDWRGAGGEGVAGCCLSIVLLRFWRVGLNGHSRWYEGTSCGGRGLW